VSDEHLKAGVLRPLGIPSHGGLVERELDRVVAPEPVPVDLEGRESSPPLVEQVHTAPERDVREPEPFHLCLSGGVTVREGHGRRAGSVIPAIRE
jgi:hypothetical protein